MTAATAVPLALKIQLVWCAVLCAGTLFVVLPMATREAWRNRSMYYRRGTLILYAISYFLMAAAITICVLFLCGVGL